MVEAVVYGTKEQSTRFRRQSRSDFEALHAMLVPATTLSGVFHCLTKGSPEGLRVGALK